MSRPGRSSSATQPGTCGEHTTPRWRSEPMNPRLSVVIPALNEEHNVGPTIERATSALDSLRYDGELIVVDDGSTDGTTARVRACSARDPRVKGISLSRNFGSHAAITAGLEHAGGDACLVMTADLEEPPELMRAF